MTAQSDTTVQVPRDLGLVIDFQECETYGYGKCRAPDSGSAFADDVPGQPLAMRPSVERLPAGWMRLEPVTSSTDRLRTGVSDPWAPERLRRTGERGYEREDESDLDLLA